jgi:hypothetical protein
VGGNDDGFTLFVKVFQDLQQFNGGLRVKVSGRLIGQDD